MIVFVTASCSAQHTPNSGAPDAATDAAFNLDGGAQVDPKADNDHDGYVFADDCNDGDPLVNPGAYEILGDGVDNDCDGKIDVPDDCGMVPPVTSTNPTDYAKAAGLCRFTTANATGKDKRWGVISATLGTSDGVGQPAPIQLGIVPVWGALTANDGAEMIAVLSTGAARLPSQAGWFTPRPTPVDSMFTNTGNVNSPPAGWPRNSTGCPSPQTKLAFDSVAIKVKIRVPTNAKGFTFDFDFHTSEYLDYVCSPFNDTFVAILRSAIAGDPAQGGNVVFDKNGDPINVNSGFFEACAPGTQAGKTFACALGRGPLAGTGFDLDGGNGGATGWLRTKAAVQPGETIDLAFLLWNTGDHLLQSTVLVADWQWSKSGDAVGTDRPK